MRPPHSRLRLEVHKFPRTGAVAARIESNTRNRSAFRGIVSTIVNFGIRTEFQIEFFLKIDLDPRKKHFWADILVDCCCPTNVQTRHSISNQVFDHCLGDCPRQTCLDTSAQLLHSANFYVYLRIIILRSSGVYDHAGEMIHERLKTRTRVRIDYSRDEATASQYINLTGPAMPAQVDWLSLSLLRT
mmetsp:Transcript_28358/g.40641  ORF Transcript_28358/g.40641 Transcript_28358/m.40641 type:complete len:187 (+) Transcript_28358:285-845(+)